MKTSELKSCLTAHLATEAHAAKLEELQTKAAAELATLENAGDLQHVPTLEKIGRLRLQLDLIPARLVAMGQATEASRVHLLESAEQFVEQTLLPKISVVRAIAAKNNTQTLNAAYSGPKLLAAVNESDTVSQLDQFPRTLLRDSHPADAKEYVSRRLAIWQQVLKIEKAL